MAPVPRTFGTVVLGAGIFGSALAHHLSQLGEQDVLLYDRDFPTAGASGKGAGIVSSSCWNAWDVRLVQEAQEEYRGISDEWGLGAYSMNGGVRTVTTDPGVRLLEQRDRELRSVGVESRLLGREELERLLPAGNFVDVRAALHTPQDAVVSPPELTFAYAELAAHRGVEVVWGHGAPRLGRASPGWNVETLGGSYRAERLVLSCGAWTKRVLNELELPLPFSPYRTQACRLRPPTPAPRFPSFHDTERDVYLRPSVGGRIVAGDGTENFETDPEKAKPSADFGFLEHIAEAFRDRLPGWAGASVESSWAGVCTATPDRYPLVGKVPGADGLFVGAGFNGFGVMRAGALARRLAEGILRGTWGPLAPADPSRFPERTLRFDPRPGCTLEA